MYYVTLVTTGQLKTRTAVGKLHLYYNVILSKKTESHHHLVSTNAFIFLFLFDSDLRQCKAKHSGSTMVAHEN